VVNVCHSGLGVLGTGQVNQHRPPFRAPDSVRRRAPYRPVRLVVCDGPEGSLPVRYVILLRGVNVGGASKVPMVRLRSLLAEDYDDVATYIASGNILLSSERTAEEVADHLDELLQANFELTALVRSLVLDAETYQGILDAAPAGFGADPETYRYDVGFYMGVTASDVEPYLDAHPEVDVNVVGERAFYHRRVKALASRSRLGKIVGTPIYASLTIRGWGTTAKLAELAGGQSS
jgi:uncharacterized protein (DUF1697 family)